MFQVIVRSFSVTSVIRKDNAVAKRILFCRHACKDLILTIIFTFRNINPNLSSERSFSLRSCYASINLPGPAIEIDLSAYLKRHACID